MPLTGNRTDLCQDRTTVQTTKNGKSSATSQSRNRNHVPRYRVRAPTSEVDETLFGTDKKSACKVKNHAENGCRTQKCSAVATKAENPETILLLSRDLIRNLRIPRKDPSEQSIILHMDELERILANSHVLTKEERDAALATQRKAQEEARSAADVRKMLMRQADLSRQKKQPLSDLEAEANAQAQYLLVRSNNLRMEQEDEIKKLKQLILFAKCQEVRDDQIEQKKQIHSEMQEEESRLDAMMEMERQRAVEAQAKQDELRKNRRIQGMMCNLKQIEEHEEERLLEDELKEQEKNQMMKNMEMWKMQELEALERKKEEQKKLHKEIQKNSEDSLHAKERIKEEERLANHKAMEYTRIKMEREAAYEAEQTRIKKEKEIEMAQLRRRQEKAKDFKAEQDAIRARRHQEAVEREWRRKDKEQAKKKLEEHERLKAARLEHLAHKQHMMSVKERQKKDEFNRLQSAQKEHIAQDKAKKQQERQEARHFAEELQHQMRERKAQANTRRKEAILERQKLDEEQRIHQARVENFKEKTLKELKEYGLPDKYYLNVKRKADHLPKVVQ